MTSHCSTGAVAAPLAQDPPGERFRLTLGLKFGLLFALFMAATAINLHVARSMFDSLDSSTHIVNDTGRLRYLSQKIAYLATRLDGEDRGLLHLQINDYAQTFADIKQHLQNEGRSLLEHAPELPAKLDGLRREWQGYAKAVSVIVASNLADAQSRRALSYLHRTADAILIGADDITNAIIDADRQVRQRINRTLFGMLALEGGLLLCVLVLIQRGVSRPIRRLARMCHSFAAGEHGVRMPPSSHDEVGDLARSFNRTAEITAELIQNLNERTREARVLHHVAALLQEDITCRQALERIVAILWEDWQHPGIAAARAACGEIVVQSPTFRSTPWCQHVELVTAAGMPLRVEICHLESLPSATAGPFLAEERAVLENVAHMLKSFCDRNDAQQAQARLISDMERLANYDSLTGLPNRALLRDRLDQALAVSHRQRRLAAVMYLDLDRFKTVNDTLGHDTGDRLLQEVARRLGECLREGDTLARLGGDEFVAVLPVRDDASEVDAIADCLIAALAAPFLVGDHELFVSGSLGISLYPRDGTDGATLLRHADIAMYRAKDEGRNHRRHFTAEMNVRAHERLTLENSLRHAIERDEFVLHYQPQVDFASGRIVGMEALVRWLHPELGMVPPARFIPLAEETGLIAEIGEWVLRTACAQNRAWQDEGLPALRVAVNLSARQFRQRDVVELVTDVLRATDLGGEYLDLELTESMLMHAPEEIIPTLAALKQLGVHIALDDFGTGYSSLAYLQRFPIDEIKIDQSFIRDIGAGDAPLVLAILGVARGLALGVVAEGVETAEQHRYLQRHGCDRMQGYLFSRPVPADEMARLLAAGARLDPSGRANDPGQVPPGFAVG